MNRLAFYCISGALLIGVGTFLVMTLGQVRGEEFSPYSFRQRSYLFYEVPGLRWQISPVFRDSTVGDLERSLTAKGMIKLAPDSRWDVIRVAQGGQSLEGEAVILDRYLQLRVDGGSCKWLEWTLAHDRLAPSLWAAVQHAAIHDAYELIPELFRFAERHDNQTGPQEFAAAILQHQQVSIEQIARDRDEAGQNAEASTLRASADSLQSAIQDAIKRSGQKRSEKESESESEQAAEIDSAEALEEELKPEWDFENEP
jgi:hypothetical protein